MCNLFVKLPSLFDECEVRDVVALPILSHHLDFSSYVNGHLEIY